MLSFLRAFFMLNGHIKLFVSVIVQAILDALNIFYNNSKKNEQYNEEAINWLIHKDFAYVCDLADLHPDYVLYVYLQLKEYNEHLTYEQTHKILHEKFTRSR
tara:strand:- start:15828 stop:16133 length:306 start_codon:yes stop_codon:yes gene_type:complete